MVYTEGELLRLARRWKNTRRGYLLVNPLQGKHLPVSPGAALDMMSALGDRLASACPEVGAVIGFAETATAVGAAVAARQGGDCFYLHTTREPFAAAGDALAFLEEHSHAAEQWLYVKALAQRLSGAGTLALVDDEISTGRTLENIAATLRERFPALRRRRLVAASIINRLSAEREAALAEQGIDTLSLLKLPLEDYTAAVERFEIHPADLPEPLPPGKRVSVADAPARPLPDLRRGAPIGRWWADCEAAADALAERLKPLTKGRRVLALGTEECMAPALILGRRLEREDMGCSVLSHATTRSPIGICREAGYPIHSGARLPSFYEAGRPTFIYNLAPCDAAVIVTDTPDEAAEAAAIDALAGALWAKGCREIALIRRFCDVWHL